MTLDELLALPARVEALETALPARIRALETAFSKRNDRAPVCDRCTVFALWTPALTEREQELLPYLAAGWTNQEIANHLVIAERTVRTHVSNILSRLQTTNRTTLALWALATGQVELNQAVALMGQQQPHLLAGEACG